MFEVIWLYDGIVIWIVWIEFHITTAESSHCTNMSLDIEEIRNIIVGLPGGGIEGWGGVGLGGVEALCSHVFA
jgi:nanoRNase/pAp phosphatase (c-di-AMP/oligoRNAs hydrolase)